MKYISSITKLAKKSVPKPENHGHTSYTFELDNKKVGWQLFNEKDVLIWEKAFKKGKMHGVEYYFFDKNGTVSYVSPYVNGLVHGTVKQFSPKGKLIHETVFEHGTGSDLWYCFDENEVAYLSEERHYLNGINDGVERWWNDEGTICHELYYHQREYHGIYREWDIKGQLEDGFPKFFIGGKEVEKAVYLKASQTDSTLIKYQNDMDSFIRNYPF